MENNDWTDILYILVAVAFGIIGKLAKKKKLSAPPKKVEPQPEEFVVEESTPQSEEFVGEESTPQPKKSKAESIFDTIFEKVFYEDLSAPEGEKHEEVEEAEEASMAEIKQEPVAKKSGLAELLEKRHEEELREEAERAATDFDLRQAVIYSEILNKKYS